MKRKTTILAVVMALAMIAAFVPSTVLAQGINATATVGNDAPEIKCKCEGPDWDNTRPGTQILPDPNGPKTVTICACVCDPNGANDIANVTAEVFYPDTNSKCIVTLTSCNACPECTLYEPEITSSPTICDCSSDPTCQLYNGTFDMASCDPAGEYRVVLNATDNGGNVDKMQNRFFYDSIHPVEIAGPAGAIAIDFGDVKICVTKYVAGWTIHNSGNDPAVANVSTQGLKNATGYVGIQPGDLDIAIDSLSHEWLNETPVLGPLECCDIHNLNFSIHARDGTPPDTYAGTIVFTITHAPNRTVLFENKDDSDAYLYDPYLSDGMEGDMTFDIFTGDFTFNGYGLDSVTNYSLIHYSEPWATQGSGCEITNGTTNATGYIQLTGTLPPGLPSYTNTGDYEYDLAGGKYAKIWLVPSTAVNAEGKLVGYPVDDILFEIETIETQQP